MNLINKVFHAVFYRINNLTVQLLFLNSFVGVLLGKLIRFFSNNRYRIVPISYCTHLEGRKTVQEAYDGYVLSPAEIDKPSVKIKKHYAALGYNIISGGFVHSSGPFVLKGNRLYRQDYDSGLSNKEINFKLNLILQTTGKYAYIKASMGEHYEKGIFLGGSWNNNWYHWIIEILPKIEIMQYLPEEERNYPILAPKEIKQLPNLYFMLKTLFPNQEIIFIEQNTWSAVDKLIWIDSPNICTPASKSKDDQKGDQERNFNFDAAFSKSYRDRILKQLKIPSGAQNLPTKIFFARKQNKRAYNQDALLEMLHPYGFIPVYLERLTVIEQIALLQNAEFIIGPTGSAWANLLFCKENAQGILFGPEVIKHVSNYANFSMLNNIQLIHYYYPCKATNWLEYMHSDETTTIDINEFESIVVKMLENKEK